MTEPFQTEPATAAVICPAVASAEPIDAATGVRPRLDSIDFLRGLIMVIMALDHVRAFLGDGVNLRDVHDTSLFLTRWITHFCAPIFIFLAGVSAYLYGSRGRSKTELARFLLSRGAWLILIELTLVRFAWTFNASYDFAILQVIWVIGCAMVVLAGLIFMPRWAIATFALAMILGHNMFDDVEVSGPWQVVWMLMHSGGTLHPTQNLELMALYAFVPWIAVMAAGYVVAPAFQRAEPERRRILFTLGLLMTAGFVVLRATNLYGDPARWAPQGELLATVLSFINCEKYPPSLLYLAMTLGPGLIVLGLFRSARTALGRAIVTIGRVPFLFYVVHLVLVHAMAVVAARLTFGDIDWLFRHMPIYNKPAGYGLSLPAVYVLWIVAVVLLYPMCRWFAQIKQRRQDWWLSYL
jgi:uncharacterized membrane protein